MGGPPLWTKRPRKRGYEIPHSQRMFGERGFQLLKNLVQLGRVRRCRSLDAKLFNPVI